MNYYTAYGLTIHSEIPLPELLPGSTKFTDVSIRYGIVPDFISEDGCKKRTWEAVPGKFLIRVHNVANYFVQNGSEIIVERVPGSTDEDARVFLLGAPLAALLHQRGMLALHASAVQTENGAVLFAGKSGSGKSTLVGAFLQRGYALLADDILGIRLNDGGHPFALPALPRARLWGDSLSALEIASDSLHRMRNGMEKYLLPVENFCTDTLPVFAVYILTSHNRPDTLLEPLTDADGLAQLIRHTYRKKFVYGLGSQATHFKIAAAVCDQARKFRIIRPGLQFALDGLVQQIEASWR